MSKFYENMYKASRANAGLSQERAAELLNVSPRTLSDYENGHTRVADDIVSAMAEVYDCPLLAWWHIKETSPLGKFLPDIVMPKTHGDMAFQLISAQGNLAHAVESVKEIMSDGIIHDHEREDFDRSMEKVRVAKSKLLSTILYAEKLQAVA